MVISRTFVFVCMILCSCNDIISATNSKISQIADINRFSSMSFVHLLPIPVSGSNKASNIPDTSELAIDENQYYHIPLCDFTQLIVRINNLIKHYPNDAEYLKATNVILKKIEAQTNELCLQLVLPSYQLVHFITPGVRNNGVLVKSDFEEYKNLSNDVLMQIVDTIRGTLCDKYHIVLSQKDVQEDVQVFVDENILENYFKGLGSVFDKNGAKLSPTVLNDITKTYSEFALYIKKYFNSISKYINVINSIVTSAIQEQGGEVSLFHQIKRPVLELQNLYNVIKENCSPAVNNMKYLLNTKYKVFSDCNDNFMQNLTQSIIQIILQKRIDHEYNSTEMELRQFHINSLTSNGKYVENIANDAKENLKHMHNYLAQICKLITFDTKALCGSHNYYKKDTQFSDFFWEQFISNIDSVADLENWIKPLYDDQYVKIFNKYEQDILEPVEIYKSFKFQALENKILQYVKQYNDMCSGKGNIQAYDFNKVLKELETELKYLETFLKPYYQFLSNCRKLQSTFITVLPPILYSPNKKYGVVFSVLNYCHNLLSKIHDYYKQLIIGADGYIKTYSEYKNDYFIDDKLLYEMRTLYAAEHYYINTYQYGLISRLKIMCAKLLENIMFDKNCNLKTLIADCIDYCCNIRDYQLTEHINDFYANRSRILAHYSPQQSIDYFIQSPDHIEYEDKRLSAEFSSLFEDLSPIPRNDYNEVEDFVSQEGEDDTEGNEIENFVSSYVSNTESNMQTNVDILLSRRKLDIPVESNEKDHELLLKIVDDVSSTLPLLNNLKNAVYKMTAMDCYYMNINSISQKLQKKLGPASILFVPCTLMNKFKNKIDNMKKEIPQYLNQLRLILTNWLSCSDRNALLKKIEKDNNEQYNFPTLIELVAKLNNYHAFLLWKIYEELELHKTNKTNDYPVTLFLKIDDKEKLHALLPDVQALQKEYLGLIQEIKNSEEYALRLKEIIKQNKYENTAYSQQHFLDLLNELNNNLNENIQKLKIIIGKRNSFTINQVNKTNNLWNSFNENWNSIYGNYNLRDSMIQHINKNHLSDIKNWYSKVLYSKLLFTNNFYLFGIYQALEYNYYIVLYDPIAEQPTDMYHILKY